MNGEELKLFLSKFPCLLDHFKGIFFIDQLPKFLKIGDFVICNTDTHDGNGKHWIAFVSFKNFIECFDSLGVDHEKKLLLTRYCRFKNKRELIFNETSFQQDNSDTCGKFVLYFIVQRYFNLDLKFKTILEEIFVNLPRENESLVTNFYLEYGESN